MADVIRYYMPCSGSPAHTPSRDSSWDGTWDDNQIYAAVTTKIASALTEKNCGILIASGTQTILGCRWVTAAQASAHDWTVADSIKAEFFARYNANVTSAYFHAIFRVMNAGCTSEVGVLWEGDLPTALLSNWPGRNRSLAAGGAHVHVQNEFSMSAGDHIVIELGAKVTATAQYAGISFYIGDDQDSDYPENETTATQTDDTWVEFTMESSSVAVTPEPSEIAGTFGTLVPTTSGEALFASDPILAAYSQPTPSVTIIGPPVGAYVSPTIIMGW